MEKTAVIVPGEKKEPPGPYSIGFENILVAKARVGWWKFSPFQHASRRLLALPVGAVNGTYNICHREYPWMFQVAIKSLDQGGIRIGTEKKILGLRGVRGLECQSHHISAILAIRSGFLVPYESPEYALSNEVW